MARRGAGPPAQVTAPDRPIGHGGEVVTVQQPVNDGRAALRGHPGKIRSQAHNLAWRQPRMDRDLGSDVPHPTGPADWSRFGARQSGEEHPPTVETRDAGEDTQKQGRRSFGTRNDEQPRTDRHRQLSPVEQTFAAHRSTNALAAHRCRVQQPDRSRRPQSIGGRGRHAGNLARRLDGSGIGRYHKHSLT
jgi:hypothetical protein